MLQTAKATNTSLRERNTEPRRNFHARRRCSSPARWKESQGSATKNEAKLRWPPPRLEGDLGDLEKRGRTGGPRLLPGDGEAGRQATEGVERLESRFSTAARASSFPSWKQSYRATTGETWGSTRPQRLLFSPLE